MILGLVENMPAETYHAIDAVSSSRLKEMRRSPMHCRYRMTHPKSSRDLLIGQATHTAILEPNRFDAEYVIGGPVNPKTGEEYGEATKAWAAFEEEQGRRVLSRSEAAMIRRMAYAVHGHKAARELLHPTVEGMVEVSAFWIDNTTGLYCKARADKIVNGIISDLKTDRDASPHGFERSAAGWGYNLQDAWYRNAFSHVGVDVRGFRFAVVEKDEPHGVAVYEYDVSSVERSVELVAKMLTSYADCQKSGQWNGYSAEVETICLPTWLMGSEEITLDGESI